MLNECNIKFNLKIINHLFYPGNLFTYFDTLCDGVKFSLIYVKSYKNVKIFEIKFCKLLFIIL